MRLLHTSDWHLGRSLHGEGLADAQAQALAQLVQVVDDHAIDAVLVAGDVFDRAVPPVEAVAQLATTLEALAQRVPTIVISGNHDSAVRLGFGSGLLRPGMHITTQPAHCGRPVVLADADGPVLVYPIPYLEPDVARVELATDPGHPLERSHEAVLGAAMQRVNADFERRREAAPTARCVVLAHAFVVGSGGEAACSESERDLRVGGTEAVSAEVFAGAHYVALGHLHGAQQPGSATDTTLRYSGSPLRYSFSESGQGKSVTVVDLGVHGVSSIETIPVRQPRGMAVLSGSFTELLDPRRHAALADHWLQVTVTDAARPPELVPSIRQRFPHALVVRHVPESGPLLERGHLSGAGALDPVAVAASFVEYVTGAAASPAELDVFTSAYEQARGLERSA